MNHDGLNQGVIHANSFNYKCTNKNFIYSQTEESELDSLTENDKPDAHTDKTVPIGTSSIHTERIKT